MALSGIEIYKLLPQTNCKECGFPTCLAFSMKLAAKQVDLDDCPYVEEESKKKLAESAAPPIRLVELKAPGGEAKAGNEVVLFRHEKTFYNKPGVFVRVRDTEGEAAITEKVGAAVAVPQGEVVGLSSLTRATNWGSSAGANPMNEAMVKLGSYPPITGVCAVPVLPAIR